MKIRGFLFVCPLLAPFFYGIIKYCVKTKKEEIRRIFIDTENFQKEGDTL